MRTRKDILKPRVMDCVARLQKFIDMDAPAILIGSEIWLLFRTALACYGTSIGKKMLGDIMADALHGRGLCHMEECVNTVQRPNDGLCATCAAGLDKLIAESEATSL